MHSSIRFFDSKLGRKQRLSPAVMYVAYGGMILAYLYGVFTIKPKEDFRLHLLNGAIIMVVLFSPLLILATAQYTKRYIVNYEYKFFYKDSFRRYTVPYSNILRFSLSEGSKGGQLSLWIVKKRKKGKKDKVARLNVFTHHYDTGWILAHCAFRIRYGYWCTDVSCEDFQQYVGDKEMYEYLLGLGSVRFEDEDPVGAGE